MIDLLLATGASAAVLAAIYGPLERMFPARPGQAVLRRELAIDAAFFLGQYLVFSAVAVTALTWVDHALAGVWPMSLRTWSMGLPLWTQVVLALVLGDLLTYWFHRACHSWGPLWRFHAVHHSSEELDWLAAHREHPVDGVLTQLCVNLPGIALGLPFAALGGLAMFRGLWAILIHANVQLPLGPLGSILGAPELHHWHHARAERTRHNFANLAPYLDLLFGTYHRPRGPETYPLGLTEPWPRRYLAQLVRPFRRG
ncbi:Sterol desaturase/sphingolipid hydroxylase, fatty acid hydroxylase superfamily [Nannocystis exedens]|uniref:Sterol desaturase/sphingolipid hydroxylase, fatty acid hydroxylase superfamily n=1 Tax=Nannocystis exedens TaxID=54 RepID=A0A1I1VUP1_9BACT|nr:sterol desaturase family protein [Nannocystis exedens]PCC72714.1 Fatty acid hydroxylase superfamily protein [Nannocystis exedens]SFD84813.1 Sterol desaturase/sphingolipid hydroxylase, fatty acid hydroxylase superfamily [Nannocystis exedens]